MIGLQFKITLMNIQPPIWRRIVVPENYSFYDLHVAIQDAFGWLDRHLHSFELPGNRIFQIGVPDPSGLDFMRTEAGWKIKVKKFVGKIGGKIKYSYDFGDGWVHAIEFEKMYVHTIKKPLCLDGGRACPPEDCGGVPGYEDFCSAMKLKKGGAYKEMKQWYGKNFDPEEFDPKKAKFDDPKKRLKILLEMQ